MEKKKFLVVDDEPAVLKVCGMALAKLPIEIVAARDKKEALKKLKENVFDGVLADYKLLQHDGLSIIKEARKLYPKIYAILMTGTLKSEELEKKIRKTKIDKCIFKPFTVNELREAVRECFGQ